MIFDWDDANIRHIARHHVSVAEAEFVLLHATIDIGYQVVDCKVSAMPKRIIPAFSSEAEEAQWWFDHRAETSADLLAAVQEGRSGMGSLGRAKKLREEADKQAHQAQATAAR